MGNKGPMAHSLPTRARHPVHSKTTALLAWDRVQTPEDDVVLSDEIITVRDKIDAAADGSRAADETYISLTLKNGTNIEKHISHALGSLEMPMTDAQLKEKFIDQCLPIQGSSGVQQASKSCWELEWSSDVRQIARSI